jgi:hypothetical protein
MYIKVTNNGSIKPEALELLGYSTKRNNSATIGEKGTGLKFSLIQACRDGLEFAIATDSFICTTSTEKVDLENKRIILNYKIKGNKNIKKVKTSFTIHAGHTEWNDDWFILREVLQNAIDTELELQLNRFGVDESIGDLAPQFLSESGTIDYVEAGKTVLIIKNYNLYSSLEALGVATVKNWKIAKKEYNFIHFYFPDEKKQKIKKILDFFGYSKQIRFYDDIVDEAGFYNQVKDYIALSVSTVLSSDLESTLVHELIHWKYRVDNETRAYQDICTELIASLI